MIQSECLNSCTISKEQPRTLSLDMRVIEGKVHVFVLASDKKMSEGIKLDKSDAERISKWLQQAFPHLSDEAA